MKDGMLFLNGLFFPLPMVGHELDGANGCEDVGELIRRTDVGGLETGFGFDLGQRRLRRWTE